MMTGSVRNAAIALVMAVLAVFGAGCAQTGTHYSGKGDSTYGASDAWPQPTISNVPAPQPREPTLLPEALAPAEPTPPTELRAAREAARLAATPRRSSAAPRAATPAVAAPAASIDLWQRLRSGFQMAAVDSSLVTDWENYYASRPDYFAQMIHNSSHFLYHIAVEVERRRMPLEIAVLPMIESAYNPVAYSSAHASGIWQFIPSTGKHYGLKQNWWYDGRRDVIAATSAALDYLQTLYGMFNDWELALAAYNWGEGAVQRAIERNQAKGLPTNYASLENMPAETRNYLPKLMAVKNIILTPERFGLSLAPVLNEPYFEVVTLRRHIDVTRAAEFAHMTLEEFKFLNPAHHKRVINSETAEAIVLPRHKVPVFTANMSKHESQPLVSMKTHRVRAGERPETIAEKYGISVAELNRINNIGGRRHIATGATLLVPNYNDLQPALDTIAAAEAAAIHAVAVSTAYKKVLVTRGGVRRTVTVAVPARQAAGRAPARTTANRAASKGAAKPTKPGMQKIAYQPAAAKNKRK